MYGLQRCEEVHDCLEPHFEALNLVSMGSSLVLE